MKTNIHLWQYLAEFFLEWEMYQKICRENQNIFHVHNPFSENHDV